MDRPEHMKIPVALTPQEIIDECKLPPLVHKDHVFVEINKGMYGLPQAGLLANQLLAWATVEQAPAGRTLPFRAEASNTMMQLKGVETKARRHSLAVCS